MSSMDDGGSARLRIAGPADAPALLALKRQLDDQTSFMLIEPGERDASLAWSDSSAVIVAEAAGGLCGYVELTPGEFRRNRTTAYLVIGVLASASGKGLGGALLRAAREWASGRGLHRIELTVMAHNERALALYQREGYQIEGRRAECLVVDGRYVDELYMALLL
jgi:RimJ/RimL family protein N-acetyltransferase